MRSKLAVGAQVKVWINSVIGAIPALVVRDLTGDKLTAAQCNAMDGECVYEVRYTDGPHRGTYTNCPARSLRTA